MLNFCCKLAVLYHGTAMAIAPLLKRAFGRNSNMRRKTKQLLATGMALAVLATNLTPLSFAAEQPDAEPAAAASGDMYDADAISDFTWDWTYEGYSWSSDYATATFNFRNKKMVAQNMLLWIARRARHHRPAQRMARFFTRQRRMA